jgi:hypothetical protein
MMADIAELILADHEWFREQFARLDDLQARAPVSRAALERVWRPLADKLDVHAYIEETIFYPQLLQRGVDDPVGETLMRSVITTTSVTACARPTRRWRAPTSGGRRSVVPARRTTTTWLKKNAKDCRIFAATHPSVFARHLASNTASSWPPIPRPKGC